MLEQWRSRSSFPRWDSHTHFIPPFIYIYKSPQVYQQFGDLHGRGRKHDWNMTCLKAIRTGFALRIPLGAKLKGYETRRLLRIIHRPAIQKRTNGGGLFLAWEPIDRFQSEAPRHIVLYKFERTRGAKGLLKMAIKATVPLLASATYCLSLALFISSSFGPVWHYRHKALVRLSGCWRGSILSEGSGWGLSGAGAAEPRQHDVGPTRYCLLERTARGTHLTVHGRGCLVIISIYKILNISFL